MSKARNTVIMHISDMHFGIPEKRQTASDRDYMLKTFTECFEKLLKTHPNWSPDILVVSGDIAWSGSVEDYKKAEEFFKTLLSLKDIKISPSKVVVCFGNHDVCADPFMRLDPANDCAAFDKKKDEYVYRPPNNLKDTDWDKYTLIAKDVEGYYHRFENVENFCNQMGFVVLSNFSPNRVYKHAYGSCSVEGIDFICLNTEWDYWGSKDKLAKERLRIGTNIYYEANKSFRYTLYPFLDGMPPRFVVYHRSIEHLHKMEHFSKEPDNSDKCIGNLIHRNDVSLNGHEHRQNIERFGAHTRILAGTVHSTDAAEFCCNLIAIPKKLKPGLNTCDVRKFTYYPNSPYNPWQIDNKESAQQFDIVRLKNESKVDEILNAFKYLRNNNLEHENEDKIKRLFPLLMGEDRAVLIALLSKDVFRIIHDFVEDSKQTENQIDCIPDEDTQPISDEIESLHNIDDLFDEKQSSEKEQGFTKAKSLVDTFDVIPTGSGSAPYSRFDSNDSIIPNKTDSKQ